MKIRPKLSHIVFFLLGLTAFVCIEILLFPGSSNLVKFKKDVEVPTISSLLTTLLFIAWLVESFLEIILKIFKIDRVKKDDIPSPYIARFTAITGFLMGLLIAWSGVSTIGFFFDIGHQSMQSQKLFGLVDSILTASVIAGGSKGIHELTSAYKKIMQLVQDRSTEKSETQSTPQSITTDAKLN